VLSTISWSKAMTDITSLIYSDLFYRVPCLRREVRIALERFEFPSSVIKQCEDILVRQIRYSRILRKRPAATRFKDADDVDWENFVWPKSRGRANENYIRLHLMATLFRVWVIAFGKVPKTNNKGYPRTPFMQFVHLILRREGIGKLESHMERFRSQRKAAHATPAECVR
jgi:hypothetical protein